MARTQTRMTEVRGLGWAESRQVVTKNETKSWGGKSLDRAKSCSQGFVFQAELIVHSLDKYNYCILVLLLWQGVTLCDRCDFQPLSVPVDQQTTPMILSLLPPPRSFVAASAVALLTSMHF